MASTNIGQRPTGLSARLDWLGEVLADRFGTRFRLSALEGLVKLSVDGSPNSIVFAADIETFSQAHSDLPCSLWDGASEGWQAPLGRPLPAPGAVRLPSPLIERCQDDYHVGYDVLGLAYWMLSRQEEVGRRDLDGHGRFPATSSHAYRQGYLERPIVDEWLHVLGQVIGRLWPDLPLRHRVFQVMASHDVDSPSRYAFSNAKQLARAMAGDVLKRRDPRAALRAIRIRAASRDRLHPGDPANTFEWIMDVAERHGLTSAFYFICGRTDPGKDALYDPEHPAIRALMGRIHARGHEIGLHPSYNTYRNPQAIAAEAKRLKRICAEEGIEQAEWGGRMHFLRWETPTTLYGWAQAGMTYDSSLSYADLPGFRCGTCFEYSAFDPVAGKRLDLRIRPLIAMECTVMAKRYMGLGTEDAALAKFVELKDACRAVGGCFTTLWHNTVFADQQTRALYQALLAA